MQQEEIGGFNESFERYKDRITNFSNEFEFGLFMHIFKRSLPVVLSVILLSGFLAFLYLRYTTPIYESTTTLQIEETDQAKMILKVDNFNGGSNLSKDVELLRSKFIIEKCVDRLNLPIRYFASGKVLGSERYRSSSYEIQVNEVLDSSRVFDQNFFVNFSSNGKFYIVNQEIEHGPFEVAIPFEINNATLTLLLSPNITSVQDLVDSEVYFRIVSKQALANELSSCLKISVLNSTAKTILVSYQTPNARLSRDLASNHAQTFLDFNQAQKELSSQKVIDFIDSQLDTVSENLRNAEFLLNSFKQEHKLSNIENISDIFLDRLNKLEERIFHLELEEKMLLKLSKVDASDTNELDIYALIAMLSGTRFEQSLQSLLNKLAELLQQKEELFFEVTEENEAIRSLNYRVQIQKNLIKESLQALQALNNGELKDLRARSSELNSRFSGIPTQELEYARYQRLYNINERYYSSLLEKKIEFRISKAGRVSDNKILELAKINSIPIKPNRQMTYFGAFTIGLILGLLYVVIRYLLHNNITSLNEIAKLSNASIGVLGIVPKFKEDIPVSQLIINRKPKSLIAESFRSIRTNMEFLGDIKGSKVISITSTISAEGKTFVALNLAGIIALSGKKVVILDLDMRRPKIHKGFGVDNDRGMSTMLINKHTLQDCVRHSELEGLDYITAGPIAPNPSELMISPRMGELVAEAKAIYDIVVIDNPPVGLVTDGIASIRIADYPIYIFRADYSKKHFVQNVDRLINENGIKKLSVILNGVNIERNKYGSHYGYGYGYGYGYAYESGGYGNSYYGDEKETTWWNRLKKKLWK